VKSRVFEGEGADAIVCSTLIAQNMDSDSQVQLVSWGIIALTTTCSILRGGLEMGG
jgi:hypothetical protein